MSSAQGKRKMAFELEIDEREGVSDRSPRGKHGLQSSRMAVITSGCVIKSGVRIQPTRATWARPSHNAGARRYFCSSILPPLRSALFRPHSSSSPSLALLALLVLLRTAASRLHGTAARAASSHVLCFVCVCRWACRWACWCVCRCVCRWACRGAAGFPRRDDPLRTRPASGAASQSPDSTARALAHHLRLTGPQERALAASCVAALTDWRR